MQDLRSIHISPYAATVIVLIRTATSRRTAPDASALLRGCAWPECRRAEFRQRAEQRQFHHTQGSTTGSCAMAEADPGRVGRRLAAIIAADVAGYSRLMGLDEVGTARTFREHRKVTDALVANHGGRIVKTTGDGGLLEFPSVVDAVEGAVAMQAVMAERNEGVPADRRMLFRIGINRGDILIEGDDILGDGVNVAARLEGIAEPGGVCLSSTAHD